MPSILSSIVWHPVQVVQNWVASWNLSERQDERISFKLTSIDPAIAFPEDML